MLPTGATTAPVMRVKERESITAVLEGFGPRLRNEQKHRPGFTDHCEIRPFLKTCSRHFLLLPVKLVSARTLPAFTGRDVGVASRYGIVDYTPAGAVAGPRRVGQAWGRNWASINER